jgi:serine/threonine protein kinase
MAETNLRTDRVEVESPVREGEILDGKYKVERVLGAGGMGIVVAATHIHLLQRVALKFLIGVDTGTWGERFLREARAAVRLKNGHIAKVLDVGMLASGAPYIVMEYLEGRSLGDLVRSEGARPIVEAVDFVLQACEGIAEAHASGIIHRDLKPDNLFLTRRADGEPLIKVLDFGISKTIDPALATPTLTRTHEIVGSPLYMSPEQLRSARSADVRSDIWSLGVILYELLTGKMPFHGTTYPELVLRVVEEPPPPARELRPEISPELEVVMLRCLEKDPAQRFQDVAELASALAPFDPASKSDMANRVRALLGSSSRSRAALADSGSAPVAKVQTGTSWGATRRVLQSRVTYASVGLAAILGGVAIAVMALRPPRGSPAVAAPSSEAPFASVIPPPTPAPPAAPASAQTTAAVSITPPPAPAVTDVSAKRAVRPTPPRAPASTGASPALPKGDAGDLVLERK